MVRCKISVRCGVMKKTTKYMLISLITNIFLCIFKILFGILTSTKSLIADGIHSLSDLVTDVIAIFGDRFSNKPADNGHPRGHGKIEYITSLIISLFILVLGFSILKNSFNKSNTIPSVYLLLVVLTTITVKYLVSHTLIKKGRELNNMILISSGKESYTDVYSSLLVLLVIVVSQFSNSIKILKYSDMVGSILIGILTLIMGTKLLIQSISLLIGEAEQDTKKNNMVKDIIMNRKQSFDLEECTLFKLGSYYEVVLKILVDGNLSIKEGHDLMDDIENDLLKSNLNIKYVNIHIEPLLCGITLNKKKKFFKKKRKN